MTKPQNPEVESAENAAIETNERATARDMYEITNATRRLDADRADELLELMQAQALDDSDLDSINTWGPVSRVYRNPGIESFVDLIGGDVEMEDEDEMDEEAELVVEIEDHHTIAWYKALKAEKKARLAAKPLPAPNTKISAVAIKILPGPMSSPCCRFAGKQHWHHKCTQCGGLAAAKKELDVSKAIYCSDCYAANKQAAAAK